MDREGVGKVCLALPGVTLDHPFGDDHDAWKVGGKMFASIGAVNPGVAVKTDSIETAAMLIEMGVGEKAPYFHRSWVLLPWSMDKTELRARLLQSYSLIRSALPKKIQAGLAAMPDA